jgi:hypothetical protein
MEDYSSDYRVVFPLWCKPDILDAHDYRAEVMSGLELIRRGCYGETLETV